MGFSTVSCEVPGAQPPSSSFMFVPSSDCPPGVGTRFLIGGVTVFNGGFSLADRNQSCPNCTAESHPVTAQFLLTAFPMQKGRPVKGAGFGERQRQKNPRDAYLLFARYTS